MASGLIWSALGQGLANVGQTFGSFMAKGVEEDRSNAFKERMLELQTAKQKELATFQQGLEIEGIGKKATATAAAAPVIAQGTANAAPIIAQGEANAAPIKAEGEVLGAVAKAKAIKSSGLIEANAENTAAELAANKENVVTKAEQTAQADASALVKKVNTEGYLKAVRSNALAGHVESAGSLAQAALATFQLGQQREIAAVNKALSNETDPTKREELTQKAKDLSGGSTKSFSDMVALGNGYANMAGKLRAQIKDEADEEARKNLADQATQYEKAADAVFKSVSEKRLGPGAGATPSAAAIAALKSDPSKAAVFDAKFGPGSSAKYLK
jgi:hypothetical protein